MKSLSWLPLVYPSVIKHTALQLATELPAQKQHGEETLRPSPQDVKKGHLTCKDRAEMISPWSSLNCLLWWLRVAWCLAQYQISSKECTIQISCSPGLWTWFLMSQWGKGAWLSWCMRTADGVNTVLASLLVAGEPKSSGGEQLALQSASWDVRLRCHKGL